MTDKRSKPFSGKTGIFLGGILLVAAVIAFISLDGYPPKDGETVGAIGSAKRYRSEQITPSDVQLQDEEMMALLQNDEFQKLIKDPSFQKAVREQDWTTLMNNQYYRRIFLDAGFMKQRLEPGLSGKLQQTEYANMRPEEAYKVFLDQLKESEMNTRGPRLSEILADQDFKKLFLDKALVRTLVLDEDMIRQRLDVNVVSSLKTLDWKIVRPELDYTQVKKVYLDESLAAPNPKLTELANDAEFQRLFETEAWVRRIVLDVNLAQRLSDVAVLSRVRQADLARVRPEEAYNTLLEAAKDAEMARPDPQVTDLGSQSEFQKFFEHKLAREIVLDAGFFKPLLETGLADRLRELDFVNMRPEVAYNSFMKELTDANLAHPMPHTLQVAQDVEFANLFKEYSLLRTMVLDVDFASKFAQLNLASRVNEAEFLNMRPEVAYNTFMTAAADVALNSPDRRTFDYAADERFKNMYQEQEYARGVLVDVALMHQLLDKALVSRFDEIKFANLRPEVSYDRLKAAVNEASLGSPHQHLTDVVNDAKFMNLYLSNDVFRQIMTDQKYARALTEVGMASRLSEVNLLNLRPELSYHTLLAEAADAKLDGRNARMASWAADAQFKQLFENMKLARAMAVDVDLMSHLLEANFSTIAARADLRNAVTDVDYLEKHAAID